MFKLATAALTASLVAASAAVAADLPLRSEPPPFVAPPPVFTWTGFYIGANAGAAFDNRSGNDTFDVQPGSIAGSGGSSGTLDTSTRRSDAVFTGGGQIGYNYQFASRVVVGLEADAQYIDLGTRDRGANGSYVFTPRLNGAGVPALGLAFAPPAATVAITGAKNPDFFGTVRGRLGYGFNQALLYATGGLAYGDGSTGIGYAVGGGLEYAVTRNVSVKLEGLYVDLRNGKQAANGVYDINTNVLTLRETRRGLDFEVARAGINYRF